MSISQVFERFDSQSTLLMISSFPVPDQDLAKDNAVAWYTHQLVKNLPDDTHIVVVCQISAGLAQPRLWHENVLLLPSFDTNSLRSMARVVRACLMFRRARAVVIQHEFNALGSLLTAGLCPLLVCRLRLSGKRVTTVLHHVLRQIESVSGHIGVNNRLLRVGINLALSGLYRAIGWTSTQIVVTDHALKATLSSLVKNESIRVIPIGTETGRHVSQQAARAHLELPDDGIILLAFGYLSWYKGTDWTIEQVAQLCEQYPREHFHLVVAGAFSPTIPNRQWTRRTQERLRQQSRHVSYLGYVPEERLPLCFAAADVALYSYRAMMASSGALSHAYGNATPFLISTPLESQLMNTDAEDKLRRAGLTRSQLVFALNTQSFQAKVVGMVTSKDTLSKAKTFSRTMSEARSWPQIGEQYLQIVSSDERR